MQLYTINATWVRPDMNEKDAKIANMAYPAVVSSMLSSYGIDGFTLQEVQGYWQGVPEASYIITVATDNKIDIDEIAETLRNAYNQDAVMVTYPDNSVKFIERP